MDFVPLGPLRDYFGSLRWSSHCDWNEPWFFGTMSGTGDFLGPYSSTSMHCSTPASWMPDLGVSRSSLYEAMVPVMRMLNRTRKQRVAWLFSFFSTLEPCSSPTERSFYLKNARIIAWSSHTWFAHHELNPASFSNWKVNKRTLPHWLLNIISTVDFPQLNCGRAVPICL